jgi:hypothetical protein
VQAAAIIIFLSLGVYYGFYTYNNYQHKNEYENIIAISESKENLEDKIEVLKNYLSSHIHNQFTPKIQNRYEEYENQKKLSEYDEIIRVADSLILQDNFNDALELCLQYHDKIPSSTQKDEIKEEYPTFPPV